MNSPGITRFSVLCRKCSRVFDATSVSAVCPRCGHDNLAAIASPPLPDGPQPVVAAADWFGLYPFVNGDG